MLLNSNNRAQTAFYRANFASLSAVALFLRKKVLHSFWDNVLIFFNKLCIIIKILICGGALWNF